MENQKVAEQKEVSKLEGFLSSNLYFRWHQVKNICNREWQGYFFSPVAYIVIAIYLAVTAWFFYNDFFLRNTSSLRQFFLFIPWIFTFIIPAITMRLYSEEYREGSYEMLRTLPLSGVEIILGKFLGALSFLFMMYMPTLMYAFFTAALGDLDWGATFCGYLGGFLLGSAYIAIGLFASSITKNQIVAFMLSVFFCFVLTSLDSFFFFLPRNLLFIFQYIGSSYHFARLGRGVMDSKDIIYFLVVIFLFLFFTHRVMQDKLKH